MEGGALPIRRHRRALVRAVSERPFLIVTGETGSCQQDVVWAEEPEAAAAFQDRASLHRSLLPDAEPLPPEGTTQALSFQGSQGRAYLFNSVVNVGCGPAEERVLLTGLHAVADIYCENCKTTLGWKYEHAFESSQKYKEGKYIIELAHMIKDNGWD
ncbi:protein yippee-like 2 [Meleagris gallopavo]|uniref:protein yippee-like 2 n=1 Tax=Meleagris gallopavo TaxID=9103 RepID=UPI00093FF234|nr:protein yippee-like 2 [Meleagris gallopavo]